MKTQVVFILSLLFGMFSFPASAQQPTASQQELINLQKSLQDALHRGDAAYVRNAVSPDFVSIEGDGGSTEAADFLRDIKPPKNPEPSPILYEFKVVQLDDECAVVTYNAVFPGSHLERYQHLSDTWVKQGGQWKLKFQQSTLNLWSAHDLD